MIGSSNIFICICSPNSLNTINMVIRYECFKIYTIHNIYLLSRYIISVFCLDVNAITKRTVTDKRITE